jgi:hypothetical protein
MAKPILTGQTKRIARNNEGNLDSIDLIPPVVPPVYPEHPTYPEFHDFTTLPLTVDGWTDLDRIINGYTDTQITYVSPNGTAAGAVYTPSSAALGGSPTNPTGQIAAFQTMAQARVYFRNGKSDVMLFERGGTYSISPDGIELAQFKGGPSISERSIVAAYGPPENARPIITSSSANVGLLWGNRGNNNRIIANFDFTAKLKGIRFAQPLRNTLIEDCKFKNMGDTMETSFAHIRRCVSVDMWTSVGGGHALGLYLGGPGEVLVEECVFDMCGYKEDPRNPATWTGNRLSSLSTGGMAAGTGVQPTRTYFDRCLYAGIYKNVMVRKNIMSRGGGGSSAQMRCGGTAESNVFIFCQSAIFNISAVTDAALGGSVLDSVTQKNLIMHDDMFYPNGGVAGGILGRAGVANEHIINDNIVAHFSRKPVGAFSDDSMFQLRGWPEGSQKAESIVVTNNVGFQTQNELVGVRGPDSVSGIVSLVINNNAFIRDTGLPFTITDSSSAAWPTMGLTAETANQYYAPSWSGFAAWQAGGRDTASTLHGSIEALASAAGWKSAAELSDPQSRNGWERDIVSFMQYVDPDYVVNENVTIDDGIIEGTPRAEPLVLWQVLSSASYTGPTLSEAEAKKVARRYHAFVAYITKARANRYGAWDWNYHADTLNNYIREGFGKTAV